MKEVIPCKPCGHRRIRPFLLDEKRFAKGEVKMYGATSDIRCLRDGMDEGLPQIGKSVCLKLGCRHLVKPTDVRTVEFQLVDGLSGPAISQFRRTIRS